MSQLDVEDSPTFKQMTAIMQEQSFTPQGIIQHMEEQKLQCTSNKQFKQYLQNLSQEEEEQFNMRYSKKLVDFQELNLIFRQKRQAELVLNIVSIMSSVEMLCYQRERLVLGDLLQVIMIDHYWINEYYFIYIMKQQYQNRDCPTFIKCIYLVMLYNQKEGFHQEFNYYLQKLNFEELFKLLNITIRNLKVMYQNKPFINQNCIALLITKFFSLQLNHHIVKEFITKSLVQSTADRNFKDVNHHDFQTYFNLLLKINKQKQKLAQGSYQKFLTGIDAVWFILQQLQKVISQQIAQQQKSSQSHEYNMSQDIKLNQSNRIQIQRSSLSPAKNNDINQKGIEITQKEKEVEFIMINNCKLKIKQQNSNDRSGYACSEHFTFSKNESLVNHIHNQDQEKENSFRQKSESESISANRNNIANIININQKEITLNTLLIQLEDIIQQIQKISSAKIKKSIFPNQQINLLLMKLS